MSEWEGGGEDEGGVGDEDAGGDGGGFGVAGDAEAVEDVLAVFVDLVLIVGAVVAAELEVAVHEIEEECAVAVDKSVGYVAPPAAVAFAERHSVDADDVGAADPACAHGGVVEFVAGVEFVFDIATADFWALCEVGIVNLRGIVDADGEAAAVVAESVDVLDGG